jgi:hydroxyethylthiazole kinase-like uncharacterized protein yjeF
VTLLLRGAAIRAIEKAALDAGAPLMERAGLAAALAARSMLRDARHQPARVLALAGPGNNGGDAFEAATQLRSGGVEVRLCCAAEPPALPADAAQACAKWRAGGGSVDSTLPDPREFDLVIDGLFGIGMSRPVAAPNAQWIEAVNAAAVPVLSLDVPSGLDADTGFVHGSAMRAHRTITFIADKPGLHTGAGPDHAGAVEVADLDLRAAPPTGTAVGALLSRIDFAACLKPRARDSHKGSYGSVGVIGGSSGMTGAALLASRAALMLGAGRVFVGLGDPTALAIDPLHPEIMLRTAGEVVALAPEVLVIGPGLGQSEAARALLEAACDSAGSVLFDADALNLIARDAKLAARVARRKGATLMTPHPLEAARLLGRDTAAVQGDRIAATLAIARLYGASVVLKGAGSVVADAAGRWWINPTGNPGMASGGMGDTLAGIAGALAAQCDEPLAALMCAVYLHGAAADSAVAAGLGPAGLTAGETVQFARRLFNRWVAAPA